jgi:hypothetical protein
MSKGGQQSLGYALMVLGGLVTGGAWAFWNRQPRTTGFLLSALIFAVVAAAILFAGITRIW